MGTLTITTGGSFPRRTKTFQAIHNGHADAVAQAIEWLASEVLPAAIAQDHRLHDEGARPSDGFERVHRDAGNGRFVTREYATAHPETTTRETR